MPSWEIFREQSMDYQQSVFLDGVPVLAIEAAYFAGWREYSHAVVAMHSFGHSGPFKVRYSHRRFALSSQCPFCSHKLALFVNPL